MFHYKNKKQSTQRKSVYLKTPSRQDDFSHTARKPFDIYLFSITLFLVFIGITMIYSSSAILAKDSFGDSSYFLKRSLVFLLIGLISLFVVKSIPYHYYKKWVPVILFFIVVLMLLCFVPGLAKEAGGATRWIKLGPFSLQPSELTKLAVIIAAAFLISQKIDHITSFTKGFMPVMALVGFFILLILAQKDLGSAFVLGVIISMMLFAAGTKISYLLSTVFLAVPFLYLAVWRVPYRRQRMLAFSNPWEYQFDSGFQILQSLVAFHSGGLYGVGLGESKQKLHYLPEAHTDFIFSIFAEEFGLIGVCLVVFLFLFFIVNGLKIALNAVDLFGMLLALGITSLIGFQAFINFSVVMSILPTKGLTLPFISYGGTSLIISLVAVGILLNISSYAREEK